MPFACQNCRRLKVKCTYDPTTSSCSKCTARNITCILTPRKKRGPKFKQQAQLEHHLDAISTRINISSNVLHLLVTGFTVNPLIKQIPIINLTTFLTDCKNGTIEPYLLLGGLSFAARAHLLKQQQEGEMMRTLGQELEDRARAAMHDTEPSLQKIQTYMLLILGNVTCGNISSAYMTVSMATRCALDMRLNHLDDHDTTLTHLQKETHRRAWWGCYLADRMSSIISSLPFQIAEEDIRVKLPGDGKVWQSNRQARNQSPMFHRDPLIGWERIEGQQALSDLDGDYSMAFMLQLVTIAGRISAFDRHHNPRLTPQEAYNKARHDYTTLKATLETWHNMLPLAYAQYMKMESMVDVFSSTSTHEFHPIWMVVFHCNCHAMLFQAWTNKCKDMDLCAFTLAIQAATNGFAILDMLFKTAGVVMVGFPLATYSIYQCALVFLHGMSLAVDTYVAECARGFERAKVMLRMASTTSALCTTYLERLETMSKLRHGKLYKQHVDTARASVQVSSQHPELVPPIPME